MMYQGRGFLGAVPGQLPDDLVNLRQSTDPLLRFVTPRTILSATEAGPRNDARQPMCMSKETKPMSHQQADSSRRSFLKTAVAGVIALGMANREFAPKLFIIQHSNQERADRSSGRIVVVSHAETELEVTLRVTADPKPELQIVCE
jgi:hypothetical protein